MRHLIDDNQDPYALWWALGGAIERMRRTESVFDTERIALLEKLHAQLRPPATERREWIQRMSPGTVRLHRVMAVYCECGWERAVWPDEAMDALNLHLREAHEKRATGYNDHVKNLRATATVHTKARE